MHVDWDWIKQRPHFIAEGLADYFDITLLYPKLLIKKGPVYNYRIKNIKYKKLYIIPNIFCNILNLKKLNSSIINIQIKSIFKTKDFDIIWFTSPLFFGSTFNLIKNGIIVYDCMDNWQGFAKNKTEYYEMGQQEKLLIDRSDIIFVSSKSLYASILKKTKNKKIILLKNAISSSFLYYNYLNNNKMILKEEYHKNRIFKLAYIGTIDKWMDFESLVRLLNEIENLVIYLIGPVCCETPVHRRLVIYGPIDHGNIPNIAAQFDGFIIPFIINDLTRAVDPIKIYEYISFRKPIIAVNYDEIVEYNKFIWTYSSYDELKDIIINLIKNHISIKYSMNEAFEYLKEHTWEKRISYIIDNLV